MSTRNKHDSAKAPLQRQTRSVPPSESVSVSKASRADMAEAQLPSQRCRTCSRSKSILENPSKSTKKHFSKKSESSLVDTTKFDSKTSGRVSEARKVLNAMNATIAVPKFSHTAKNVSQTISIQQWKEEKELFDPTKQRYKIVPTAAAPSIVNFVNGTSTARTDLGPNQQPGPEDMARFVEHRSQRSFTNKTVVVVPSERTKGVWSLTIPPSKTMKGCKCASCIEIDTCKK